MKYPVFSSTVLDAIAKVKQGVVPNTLERAITLALDAVLADQKPDGHWVYDLEADATIPAEYVLMVHYLGEVADPVLESKIANYLCRTQNKEGGWPLFHEGEMNISASVKAYFALKMIGVPPDAPHMVKAREAIRARGGAEASNVFTRILMALFGIVPWRAVPVMPVELVLLPRWFPFHLYEVSYWTRTVMVPLLVLGALKPRARNPKIVTNTIFGIGGLFDMATPAGLPKHNQDFGLTLGHWGVPNGPYLVLPLFGPSTFRDTAGLVGDTQINPTGYLDPATRNSLYGVQFVSTRARYLGATDLLSAAALDKYSFTRDAYLGRRKYLLTNGQEETLPNYDNEETSPDKESGKPDTDNAGQHPAAKDNPPAGLPSVPAPSPAPSR